MEHENATRPPVHSYDIEHHRIRCGIPGHTGASKHAASVTCQDCIRLLHAPADEGAEEPAPDTVH